MVSPTYYPKIGGVEYVVKSVSERLSKRGFEVWILAGNPENSRISEKEFNGLNVINWPVLVIGNAYYIPKQRESLKKKLVEILKEVDVVHVHNYNAVFSVWIGIEIKKISPETLLVASGHYIGSGTNLYRKALWLFWKKYVKILIQKADLVHCVSKVETNKVQEEFLVPKEKIVVIPNGIDEDILKYKSSKEKEGYTIYAGRLEKYKNVDRAILLSKKLNLKMVIIGNGPYKEKLKAFAKKYYAQNVEFKEFLPRERYLKLLGKAKFAINLSEKEAYNIFVAEALGVGTDVIVSKTILESLEEAVASPIDSTGYLVTSSKIYSWSEIVEKYINMLYRKL